MWLLEAKKKRYCWLRSEKKNFKWRVLNRRARTGTIEQLDDCLTSLKYVVYYVNTLMTFFRSTADSTSLIVLCYSCPCFDAFLGFAFEASIQFFQARNSFLCQTQKKREWECDYIAFFLHNMTPPHFIEFGIFLGSSNNRMDSSFLHHRWALILQKISRVNKTTLLEWSMCDKSEDSFKPFLIHRRSDAR